MLVQAACLTILRFCHTSKNVSCKGTAAFRQIKYRCGMRSREDDGLKSGTAWRTRAKIHEHSLLVNVWCTHFSHRRRKCCSLCIQPHIYTLTHTQRELNKCDSERFANNMQKPEAPQPNRWEKKEPPSSEARPDTDTHTHTQTISTQETKTERRAATQAHITHTTYSKLQTDV